MNSNRLASLDILRGFDLMLLFFHNRCSPGHRSGSSDSPSLIQSCIISNMVTWEGFRAWDLVMPFPVYGGRLDAPLHSPNTAARQRRPQSGYRRIGRRVVLLFSFGMTESRTNLLCEPQMILPESPSTPTPFPGHSGPGSLIAPSVLLHLSFMPDHRHCGPAYHLLAPMRFAGGPIPRRLIRIWSMRL